VADGTVKLQGVARDPGLRAKVAVMSIDRDVDPVGACVGIRGSRIQNVVQELKGERIDIVVWSPDIAMYAQEALKPAMISRITVDDEEEMLEVVVPDDQLTLAIGRKGQNVKLASKLLGWKIDIFTESRYGELHAELQTLEQIASVAEISVDRLMASGFDTMEKLDAATDEDLLEIEDVTEDRIGDIRSAINLLRTFRSEAEAPESDEDGAAEDAEEDAAEEAAPEPEAEEAAEDTGEEKNAE
jgi:N utilization substance protein A